jgi:hypothetical protein
MVARFKIALNAVNGRERAVKNAESLIPAAAGRRMCAGRPSMRLRSVVAAVFFPLVLALFAAPSAAQVTK